MKLFTKLMLAALVLAVLLPFTFLKGPDGNTLMSFSKIGLPDFSVPSLPKFSSGGSLDSAVESLQGKDIFYKWYDAEGNVQFTTEPPAEGIEYTVKGIDPDTNLIQAVKIPDNETSPDDGSPREKKKSASKPGEVGNPYTKEGIEKLFKDAENIEKILNQRMKDTEAVLNQ